MKKIFTLIKFSGVWIVPLVWGAGVFLWHQLKPSQSIPREWWFMLLMMSLGGVTYIWTKNDIRRANSGRTAEQVLKTESIFKKHSEFDYSSNRNNYLYPDVSSKMLFDEMNGYVFGKAKGSKQYVCCDMSREGQRIGIFAGSGCGKTQQTLNYLVNSKELIHSLVIDPKKEITKKVFKPGDNIIIFDPEQRSEGIWGYDPLYSLDSYSSQQDIYECMNGIATALIATDGGPNDFWKLSARDLLTGLFCFYYSEGLRNVPDIVEAILSKPIQEVMKDVISKAEPASNAYKICTRYVGMADETITSINSNMVIAITPYAVDQRLVWALKYARHKFNPNTLRVSSVYVAVSLPCMTSWASLITLIVNQFITWGLSIPDHVEEPDRANMCLVFEEFTAFLKATGRIDSISQALRFIRSKNISVILICQSISAIKAIYRNDEEVNDMLSNLGYMYFMDATEPSCQKWICDMCGTFPRRNISWNESGGGKNDSKSVSYTEEPIVRPQDLITLGGTDEAILISHIGGYNRIKKTPAWSVPAVARQLN